MKEYEDGTSTFCGTMEYMAPEMIRGEKYGKAADFWSVGVLIYDMLTGEPPFRHKNRKKLQEQILKQKILMPSYWSKDTHSIIRGLTERDPEKRLKVNDIKAHPFFKTISWSKLSQQEIEPPFKPSVPSGAIDYSNFSPTYTKAVTTFSPAVPLSSSQNDLFKGFSYAGQFSPPLFTTL
eukprot:TRINITY_DN118_c0_g1_i2.p2 TRINITY_DN118_c0_g1~~TRINITY_DN118_c0_g1_i2.p2  ORF type:complete len:179 (-),score=36.50 TRINITY_DN118_c0_g1_i2:57-593(-)